MALKDIISLHTISRDLDAAFILLGVHFTFESAAPFDETSEPLTPRQCQVLRLLAEGLSTKQIAAQLGIGTKAVEFHRCTLAKRLHLQGVAQLTRYAIEHDRSEIDAIQRKIRTLLQVLEERFGGGTRAPHSHVARGTH
ncbi:MAG: hypothetical protein NVS9B4_00060 [Candidatus Acidiferrum sp.]